MPPWWLRQLAYDRGMTRTLSVSLVLLVSATSWAHVKLLEPADWLITDSLGDPQKLGPCGGNGTASNVTTTVTAGSTLHVKWRETVLHPGHFRIAIATDRAQLQDPIVTSSGTACVSAAIQNPVVAPVVADGLFVHTSAAPQSTYETDIVVPNVACEHCTLQLIQFMSAHSTPCLYYHCADLKIVAAGVDGGANAADAGAEPRDAGVTAPPFDAGSSGGTDAGTSPELQPSSCGCRAVDGSLGFVLLLVLVSRHVTLPRRQRQ